MHWTLRVPHDRKSAVIGAALAEDECESNPASRWNGNSCTSPLSTLWRTWGRSGRQYRGMKLSALGRQGLAHNAAVVEKMWEEIERVVANLPVTARERAGLSGRIAGLRARAGDCVGFGGGRKPEPQVALEPPGSRRDTDGYGVSRTAGGRIPARQRRVCVRGELPGRRSAGIGCATRYSRGGTVISPIASTGPWVRGKRASCSWGCCTKSRNIWIPTSRWSIRLAGLR